MAMVSGCACPNCGTFIAPRIPASDKKFLYSVNRTWHLVCDNCSHEFNMPESRLDLVFVSEQWLRNHHALDLETAILSVTLARVKDSQSW
jgi:hypothetical protein